MTPLEPPATGPLTQAQHREWAVANERTATIRKAAKVAAFNGWMLGIFAALSAPFSIYSVTGILVIAGLAFFSYREFLGRRRMLRFDPTAATLLGWNQIGLLILIVVYCAWMMFDGLSGEVPFASELKANPDLAAALGSLGEYKRVLRLFIVIIYGSVIAVSAIFQGWNAAYYFSRRKHIEEYVRETPPWIISLQRVTAAA